MNMDMKEVIQNRQKRLLEAVKNCDCVRVVCHGDGINQEVESVFDTAVLALQLYKITGDAAFLQRWLPFFQKSAIHGRKGLYWKFLCSTPPPPDADTTALVLSLFTLARQMGCDVGEEWVGEHTYGQFQRLAHRSGGVSTWFGKLDPPDPNPEPVVNSSVALFFQLRHIQDELFESTRRYLSSYLFQMARSKRTRYYPYGFALLLARLSELQSYNGDFFSREDLKHLDELILSFSPTSILETAFLGIACKRRGFEKQRRKLNQKLLEFCGPDGLWPREIFYDNLRTKCTYGHSWLSSAFALESLGGSRLSV